MYIATTKNTLFAALAMASTASAHMVMENPVPFGPGKPNNSPLDSTGSNFPCKIGPGGSYVVKTMNEWTVGSDVTLSFEYGTATHAGGSCQVSVTKDKEPTPQSVWKVIHSIEGGCPTADSGNNGKINSFPFTVPSELPEGQLTMAWTWFNSKGDREMYMNCAPIKVAGGSGDGFDSLPDMAVANIAGQGSCNTTENFDYAFANPGKYVTKTRTENPVQDLCGGGGAPSEGGSTGGYGSNGGSGSPGGVNSGNSGAAVPPVPPATPIETPKQPNATTPKEPEATTPKEPESSAPKPPSTGNSSSSGSSSGGAYGGVASSGGSSCSEEGAITCKDQDHFGICSNGSLVWQSVAAGTACNNGVIARRGYMHRHQRHSI
jgi:hypothetical protein